MNYKDTKPYMSAFLFSWPVNIICGIMFNRFYRQEIHSLMVCIFYQLVNCCPHRQRNYMVLVYCCPSTVPSLWPPPSSPLPNVHCTVYTDSVWLVGGVVGGVEMYCGPYLQEFYSLFLTRLKTYRTASPPQTKKTSKDDIKGLASLKFLRPWLNP